MKYMKSNSIRGLKNRSAGITGEKVACIFLKNKGFSIIQQNYREKWGEVDIIALKDGVVRFIEVKSMSVEDFSRERSYEPEDLVDSRKLSKVLKVAEFYMQRKDDHREFQIDVVAVFLNIGKKIARCRILEQVL